MLPTCGHRGKASFSKDIATLYKLMSSDWCTLQRDHTIIVRYSVTSKQSRQIRTAVAEEGIHGKARARARKPLGAAALFGCVLEHVHSHRQHLVETARRHGSPRGGAPGALDCAGGLCAPAFAVLSRCLRPSSWTRLG